MSGSYVNGSGETVAADAAALAAALGPAVQRADNAQTASAAFVAEHGAAVIDGHATVGYLPAFLAIGD
jgi:hypothetical protein